MSETNLVIYGVVTSRTLRAHWAMAELGLTYRTEQIQSRSGQTTTPEYTALDPRQKVPVLQDGDFVLKGLAPTKVLAIYGQGAYAKKSGELAANLLTELAKRKLKATGAMRQMTYHDPGKTPADKQVSEMQIPIQ